MNRIESTWSAFRQSYYFWDWITLACGFIAVGGFLVTLILLLGLPGRIAVARKHPDAEAVYALGWLGFLAVVPWIQAFIWAFKPTDKIDVRRFPKEEQAAEREELARLAAYAYGRKPAPKVPDPELPNKETQDTAPTVAEMPNAEPPDPRPAPAPDPDREG